MKWVSINEKRPEFCQQVLCTDGEDIAVMIYGGRYKGVDRWDAWGYMSVDVKWWLDELEIPKDTLNG